MPTPTVVVAQNDPNTAQVLSSDLHAHFARIDVVKSASELRTLLLRHDARLAVLDLEMISIEEVRQLASTFCDLSIVCTHRSPDERMWMTALGAGAVEFCHPEDIRSILRASRSAAKRLAIAA
jgi:DNA-binding NarL/FixJ family response regulator